MTGLHARLVAWLAARAHRERALLGAAGAGALVVALALAAGAVRNDLAALRARVEGHRRQLDEVRRLAATLGATGTGSVEPADDGSLVAHLEGAAAQVVGRERIAGMTPTSEPAEDGLVAERVTLRLSASLAETVALLHALEAERPRLGVVRLELRKHPDDAAHFDAVLEVARLRRAE